MSYATGVDYYQVGMLLRRLGRTESEALQQFPNLLAFVLIDFAAQGIHSKGSHSMI
jgi:hypothetical protein